MSDEALRELERAAPNDPAALTKLTAERLRRNEGVVLVWVAERNIRIDLGGGSAIRSPERNPLGPEGAIEVVLRGFLSGGEAALFGSPGALVPVEDKKAWVLACLSVTDAVFGRLHAPGGRDVTGPMLLELHTKRFLTGISVTAGVSAEPGQVAETRAPDAAAGLKCSSCGRAIAGSLFWRDSRSMIPVALLTRAEREGRDRLYCCQGHAPRPDYDQPHHH